MFQIANANDNGGSNPNDELADNYPPRQRAMILFSSLLGSWVAVVAAGYLLAHLI